MQGDNFQWSYNNFLRSDTKPDYVGRYMDGIGRDVEHKWNQAGKLSCTLKKNIFTFSIIGRSCIVQSWTSQSSRCFYFEAE